MKYFLSLLIVAMLLGSCATAKPSENYTQPNLKAIVNNPETTLVDVRIPEQFEERTAPNAVNIPLASIEDNIDFFKKQKKVVIFCNSGAQATKAVEILKKNGVENVYYGKTLKNIEAIQNQK